MKLKRNNGNQKTMKLVLSKEKWLAGLSELIVSIGFY
tara:strand:+ start:83703 stop:83813 length:111 start_codon:yes stop_codon:yes gene_type:complete